jgi:hypothetical protein
VSTAIRVHFSWLAATLLAACQLLAVSHYDPTTYRNLTETKPVVAQFYESLVGDGVDETELKRIRLKLAQIYEYENGKGADNADIVQQIEVIRRMFERHMSERANGPWTRAHMENERENMLEAFDIAIATEALKNRRN